MVRYDTRFVGFGWNKVRDKLYHYHYHYLKVSHMMALASMQYELLVLPDVFLVHLPHAPSHEITRCLILDFLDKFLDLKSTAHNILEYCPQDQILSGRTVQVPDRGELQVLPRLAQDGVQQRAGGEKGQGQNMSSP